MLTSSIYPRPATLVTDPAANTNILVDDIVITSDMVKPGGGGILRLYFTFSLAATAVVSIFNNGISKGTLNVDNNNDIVSNGYYRFDIEIEAGDEINLRATQIITSSTSFFRAHLVQFGAWYLIYSHKPQRSGRSITANTNNPPQDPPSPPAPKTVPIETPIVEIPVIPDVFIEDSTHPVLDAVIEKPVVKKSIKKQVIEKPIIEKPAKVSWIKRLISKLFFWRKK